MGLFVLALGLVLVVAMWLVGEQEFQTKLVLTLVYLAINALWFVNVWFMIAAEALFCVVVWYGTFGGGGRR